MIVPLRRMVVYPFNKRTIELFNPNRQVQFNYNLTITQKARIIIFWSPKPLKTQNSQFSIWTRFILNNSMPFESKITL